MPGKNKMQKDNNIQQLVFAGGHPSSYYSADLKLKYARADGIACSLESVVVCARTGSWWTI